MQNKQGKIAVIGDKDSVLAFKAIGVDVYPETEPAAVRETIKKLARDHYSVILICERQAEDAADVIGRFKALPYPIIIPIPDSRGSNGFGVAGLKKDVEKAIGSDIIFNQK